MKKIILLFLIIGNSLLFGCGCHDSAVKPTFVESVKSASKSADESVANVMSTANDNFKEGISSSETDGLTFDEIIRISKEGRVLFNSIAEQAGKQKILQGF